MKKYNDIKLVLFFTGLTVVLTWIVIIAYGRYLRQPFYTWVETFWPNNKGLQDQIEQSVEHFFISTVVDMIVVTLLLRLVNRQQRRLRNSEEHYRTLFEHASDIIGVVRASDHLLLDVNRKFIELLGYQRTSLIGMHVCELFKNDGNESSHVSILDKFICDGTARKELDTPQAEEVTVRTASGTPLMVSVSCSTISTGNEKLFILIISDLTEHNRLEQEKQEMQRQLFQTSKLASIGELSAGVAHEINNPLNAMINFPVAQRRWRGAQRDRTANAGWHYSRGGSHHTDSSRPSDLRPPGPTPAHSCRYWRRYKQIAFAVRVPV